MKKYKFEIYLKNAVTGEKGWSIATVAVYAENKSSVRSILNSIPGFDCIIDSLGYQDVDMANLDAEEYAALERGYMYYI
jgi:hypothetical protein